MVYNAINQTRIEGVFLKHYKYKEYISNVLPCIGYGAVCGAITGALIFIFKFAASKVEALSHSLYHFATEKPMYMAVAFVALAICGVLMYFIHKLVPESRGGGIPRSEGVLRGVLSFRWLITLLGTFFGSMVSFFCGLPLGSEGPAVLMGTSVGKMCGSVSKNRSSWSRYIMTGGAGAGFAVATGAPLSGILFALEEIHKRFTPMLVLAVSVSVVSASYTNQLLCQAFGISPTLFKIDAFASFSLGDVGYLVLLGVFVAVAVGIFDSSIAYFGNLTKKIKHFHPMIKLIIVFMCAGVLALCFDGAMYSGHHTITDVMVNDKTALLLFLLFAVRLVMMLFITDSGVTGGIFIPTLAIGASFSALIAKLLLCLGMEESLFPAVVFLGMCAFIGGTLRAPLTSALLFLELTGQFSNMLFVAITIFTVTCITAMMDQTPFYDRALENMEHIQNKGKKPIIACFEMVVSHNSFVVGKAVRDIMWPHSSVVISITRADEDSKDMDNDGEKRIFAEDTLVLRARFFDESEIRNLLVGLVGSDYEIKRIEE